MDIISLLIGVSSLVVSLIVLCQTLKIKKFQNKDKWYRIKYLILTIHRYLINTKILVNANNVNDEKIKCQLLELHSMFHESVELLQKINSKKVNIYNKYPDLIKFHQNVDPPLDVNEKDIDNGAIAFSKLLLENFNIEGFYEAFQKKIINVELKPKVFSDKLIISQ